MPLSLRPFPRFYRPPAGPVAQLPSTRNGVHQLPDDVLVGSRHQAFAELTMTRNIDGAVSRGICGLLPAKAFLDGRIHPHEQTLDARLQRQQQLIIADRGALGKPVLLTAANLDRIWAQNDKALVPSTEDMVHFDGDFSQYRLRELTLRTGHPATLDLSFAETLVIADGHHRAETHAVLAASGFTACAQIPVCLVDARELTIGIFGRYLPNYRLSVRELLQKLAPYFNVRALARASAPTQQGTWTMTYQNSIYQLTWLEAPQRFTTASGWMVTTVLKDVFGIDDPTTATGLRHTPIDVLPNGLLQLPDTEALCFCGCPISTETFFEEVAAGRKLPPKSTRFSPRVPSGLIVSKGC